MRHFYLQCVNKRVGGGTLIKATELKVHFVCTKVCSNVYYACTYSIAINISEVPELF